MLGTDCNNTKWKGTLQDNPVPDCHKNPYRVYELEDIRAGLRDSIDPMLSAFLGICGGHEIIKDTVSRVGNWYKVYFLEDGTTIETSTEAGTVGDYTGIVFEAGMELLGKFTQIKLLSGKVKLYSSPF